jgi:hypothetical protein
VNNFEFAARISPSLDAFCKEHERLVTLAHSLPSPQQKRRGRDKHFKKPARAQNDLFDEHDHTPVLVSQLFAETVKRARLSVMIPTALIAIIVQGIRVMKPVYVGRLFDVLTKAEVQAQLFVRMGATGPMSGEDITMANTSAPPPLLPEQRSLLLLHTPTDCIGTLSSPPIYPHAGFGRT